MRAVGLFACNADAFFRWSNYHERARVQPNWPCQLVADLIFFSHGTVGNCSSDRALLHFCKCLADADRPVDDRLGATNDPVPILQTLASEILAPFPMESAISGVMQHNDRAYSTRTR